MRRAPTIKLDIPVRKELERLSRSRSVAVRLAERSRIVLLAAGGLDNQEIAAKLDITRQKAGRWRDRFVEDGLGGIEKDASRSGRIPSIGRRKRARIVKKTVEGKPPNATHWSRSLMARATGVSESTVGRIWRAHGLKPHLARTFKLSNDKQFVEKLEDVVGLYLNPPENAIVLSCDEKSQMGGPHATRVTSEEGAVRHPHPRLQTQRDDHDVRRAQYAGRLDYRDLYAEASSSGMDPVSQSDQTFRAERQTDPYHLRQLRHAQTSERYSTRPSGSSTNCERSCIPPTKEGACRLGACRQ